MNYSEEVPDKAQDSTSPNHDPGGQSQQNREDQSKRKIECREPVSFHRPNLAYHQLGYPSPRKTYVRSDAVKENYKQGKKRGSWESKITVK